MSLALTEDVAMVLPIPTPPGAPEDAVSFVDLSAYPRFLDDLSDLFIEPGPKSVMRGVSALRPQGRQVLKVEAVGDFEASFVPTRADFDRLDPRFRLPDAVWDQLPQYDDYGFCVFKLRPSESRPQGWFRWFRPSPKRTAMHPMAFVFPRRNKSELFFPTVHVHDGRVRATAEFDHELFCQPAVEWEPMLDWQRSYARASVLPEKAGAWIDRERQVWQRRLSGKLRNVDVIVDERVLRGCTRIEGSVGVRLDHDALQVKAPGMWMSDADRSVLLEHVHRAIVTELAREPGAWELMPYGAELPGVPATVLLTFEVIGMASLIEFYAMAPALPALRARVAAANPPSRKALQAMQAAVDAAVLEASKRCRPRN